MNLFELDKAGVTKGKQKILDDISITIGDGDFITIIGPSGSGKSTLLRLFNMLTSPDEGNIYYKGKAIEEYDVLDLRREISYVFQKPYLFGDRVIENLSFPFDIMKLPMDNNMIQQLLEDMNLNTSVLEKKNNELSGGEQQRICLIRNLLTEPRVLLLDEITASLDPVNTKLVEDFIVDRHRREGITILFVTHNLSQAERLGKKTLYLKDGRIKYYEDTKYLFNSISDEELIKFKAGER